jgi:hypothetical protein
MRSKIAAGVIALCLGVAGLVRANNSNNKVVTNPTPAVSATMELTSSDGASFTWTVSGKVKPAYRGHGANVKLLCQDYASLGRGGTAIVFPPDPCRENFCEADANVDACGNFSFQATVVGTSPQFPPTSFCTFVVHVDDAKTPGACSSKPPPNDGTPPEDPNGSAPCSGGLCPDSP